MDWKEMLSCKLCGQYYLVDVWDKYVTQIAVRVDDNEDWKTSDTLPYEKQLLLSSRGGLTEEECIMMGCKAHRVKGVVYCLDHLYEIGWRK